MRHRRSTISRYECFRLKRLFTDVFNQSFNFIKLTIFNWLFQSRNLEISNLDLNAAQFFSFSQMATLRNKKKLASVNRGNHKGHPRKKSLQDKNVPRVNQDYTTQISEKIEGRVIQKMSHNFSRTKSWNLGALSKQYGCLLNSQVRVQSGTLIKTSWYFDEKNREYGEDRSQYDPHPEVGTSVTRSSHSVNLDSDHVYHSMNLKKFG